MKRNSGGETQSTRRGLTESLAAGSAQARDRRIGG